jgi:hypothetical protein
MDDTVRILPYCKIDGIPTLKDSELAHIFDMIHNQGVLPILQSKPKAKHSLTNTMQTVLQ